MMKANRAAMTMKYTAMIGNLPIRMLAIASKVLETSKTGAPPESMSASPRTAVMEPRVMMNEGIAP